MATPPEPDSEVRPWIASLAILAAAVYSVALIAAGFLVPFYSSERVSSGGEVTHGSATLVAVNGVSVVLVLAIPLLATVAVGAALRHRTVRAAMPIAWTLTGILAGFTLLAMMSIGVFVLPVTVALVVACAAPAR